MTKKRRSRKKTPFAQKVLFVAAFAFLSFLCYRTYHQHALNVKDKEAQLKTSKKSIEKPRDQILKPAKGVSVDVNKIQFPPVLPWNRQASARPKIAFVIDDVGHNTKNEYYMKRLGRHITYAILPDVRYSAYFGRVAHEVGADVILHQPLESSKGTYPGPGLITQKMTGHEIQLMISRNIDQIPHVIGVNNHMGSLGSADERIMSIVLTELKRRRLIYLDSRTTPFSQAERITQKLGVPLLKRDVFLDNDDNAEAIRKQLSELKQTAIKHGAAIGIGHVRYNTLNVIYEELPKLAKEGFEIVRLSELAPGTSNQT